MWKKLTIFMGVLILFSCIISVDAQASGFAELKIVNQNGNPISNVTVDVYKIVTEQTKTKIYSNITGSSGIIQWSSDKIPSGSYELIISQGQLIRRAQLNIEYNEGSWSYYKITFQ